MIAVNTNISALFTQYATRANQLSLNERTERLSSGSKLNRAADDPSGLAISQGMNAQLHGIRQAIGNSQDTIHMLRLVDSFIDDIQNIMMDIRDTNVRLANQATLTNNPTGVAGSVPLVHDNMELHKESEVMKYSIYRMFTEFPNPGQQQTPVLNYNGKNIFDSTGGGIVDDLQRGFANGQVAQVGADNDTANRVNIVLDDLATYFFAWRTEYNPPPNPSGNASSGWYLGYAQDTISDVDGKLDKLNELRTQIGAQDVALQHTIDDLNNQYINIAGGKSRITDADMAVEITQNTAELIKSQSLSLTFQQANALPLLTVPLLDAIYNGLSPKMVHTGSGS